MKKILCSAFTILLLCDAVQAKTADEVQLLFLKNHPAAGFAFPVTLVKHESHTGLGDFEMRTLPGFSLQFDYAYNFNPYIGIASGSRMGIKNFGYRAAATPGEFAIQKTVSRDYVQVIPFFSIPLLLTPRLFISKRSLLQADVGGSITFFMPAGTINTLNYLDGTDLKRVFEIKLLYQDRPLFMLHAGLSYGLILKSENILKICCSLDYGRSRAIEGHYTFYGDDMKVGYGNMYSSLSSFSVGLNYVFTRAAGIQKG